MAMLNYAFSNFETKTLLPKGTIVNSIKDITLSPYNQNIVTSSDVNVVIKKGDSVKNFRYTANIDNSRIKQLQNKDVGTIDLYYNDQLFAKVSLDLDTSIAKTSFIDLLFLVFREIFLNT
jgi:D-alanyl-D-alanine carboxypeptidase